MDPRIAELEKEYVRRDLPAFAPGDTVRVRVRVREGDKERTQSFEGVCIARRGAGVNETFTLRRVSGGVGVERIFPVHSPWIAGLEVVRRGDVRRAKLYYLRARSGKRARVRERKWWLDQAALAQREAALQAAGDELADEVEAALEEAAGEEVADEGGAPDPGPELDEPKQAAEATAE